MFCDKGVVYLKLDHVVMAAGFVTPPSITCALTRTVAFCCISYTNVAILCSLVVVVVVFFWGGELLS